VLVFVPESWSTILRKAASSTLVRSFVTLVVTHCILFAMQLYIALEDGYRLVAALVMSPAISLYMFIAVLYDPRLGEFVLVGAIMLVGLLLSIAMYCVPLPVFLIPEEYVVLLHLLRAWLPQFLILPLSGIVVPLVIRAYVRARAFVFAINDSRPRFPLVRRIA
jgi:hypothetical protein